MKLDSHQHFWKYDPAQYGWIRNSSDAATLGQDYLPAQLRAETARVGIDGVIAVQARETLEETDWLLSLAQEDTLIQGVVGWVPLTAPDLREYLERLSRDPHFKGVRDGLQSGPPDDPYPLREDFNAGIALLKEFGLTYDLLIRERHLPTAIALVDRHPEQVFVLDHIAKPNIKARELEPWRTNLRKLAERPHVFCKLSGVTTEADTAAWTENDLKPYLETVLEAFGPERLMFGSDWPVCLLATSYERWHGVVARFAEPLSAAERESLWGGAARRAYRIL
jgi:L-fuconolactonase